MFDRDPTGDLSAVVREIKNNDRKIQAIKDLRMATNLGLKDAKDVIDSMWQYHPWSEHEIELGLRSRLQEIGAIPPDPSDPFEAASEVLWRLTSVLTEMSDERADAVRFLVQELDEIWGVA